MDKQLLLPGALVALGLLTNAQPVKPEKKYFDLNWKPVATAKKAAYYKLYEQVGANDFQVTCFNSIDQKLEGNTYAHGFQGVLLISRKWWLTGKLKHEVHHYQGSYSKYDGTVDAYYANGAVRRHDVYRAGALLSGACYTSQGRSEPYYPFNAMPALPGGENLSTRLLHVKRPNSRVRTGEMIMVSFIVAADGSVRDAGLYQPVTSATDSAALQVIKELPRFSAGYDEGEPIQVSYSTVAVRFEG